MLAEKSRKMRLIYLSILLSFFVAGCVHIEEYPESWKKIKSDSNSECPRVTNTYSNIGEKPDGTKVYFAVWLAPERKMKTKEERDAQAQMMEDLFDAQTVDLELSNNETLTVRATGNDVEHKWSFKKSEGQFECEEGILSIS